MHLQHTGCSAKSTCAARMTIEKGFDGIICGHLHYPVMRELEGILYCNDSDWVENCTALVEDLAGELHLIKGLPVSAQGTDVIFATA